MLFEFKIKQSMGQNNLNVSFETQNENVKLSYVCAPQKLKQNKKQTNRSKSKQNKKQAMTITMI